MSDPDPPATRSETETELGYLSVDPFLRTLVGARALQSAFELGLIERLERSTGAVADELAAAFRGDASGLRFLLGLLEAAGVVEQAEGRLLLTERFRTALGYRDLLETKIDFARLVVPDFNELFSLLVVDPAGFMEQARLFRMFDYAHAIERTPQNHERARRWMRFTTALTRYEAGPCLRRLNLGRHRRLLDIGGNSGELALQACRRQPQLEATVFDLPVVCDVGREHVAGAPEAARICFVPGNALEDPLPGDCDLVSFKSMLHDWPEAGAARLLERAAAALRPGGRLSIFERGPFDFAAGVPDYSLIPMLLFFRSFRDPRFYRRQLETLGFEQIASCRIDLETTFFLTTATKPA